jgi:hypothetical protein
MEAANDPEIVLAQFNRLLAEVLRGNVDRNTFRRWEVDLLLDIQSCNLRDSGRRETLRRYQKAVQRSMDRGAAWPMKLSDYLGDRVSQRAAED